MLKFIEILFVMLQKKMVKNKCFLWNISIKVNISKYLLPFILTKIVTQFLIYPICMGFEKTLNSLVVLNIWFL